jgi:hypothetical protein
LSEGTVSRLSRARISFPVLKAGITAYAKKHHQCRVHQKYKSPDGYPLGKWVSEQRRSDALSPELRTRLDALGFDWDPRTTDWEEGFEHLREYATQHGHCRVPFGYKSSDGYPLGAWVGDRRESRGLILSATEKQRLTSLGFIWKPQQFLWEKGFEHLTAYAKEHHHCRVHPKYKSADGISFGALVSSPAGTFRCAVYRLQSTA